LGLDEEISRAKCIKNSLQDKKKTMLYKYFRKEKQNLGLDHINDTLDKTSDFKNQD